MQRPIQQHKLNATDRNHASASFYGFYECPTHKRIVDKIIEHALKLWHRCRADCFLKQYKTTCPHPRDCQPKSTKNSNSLIRYRSLMSNSIFVRLGGVLGNNLHVRIVKKIHFVWKRHSILEPVARKLHQAFSSVGIEFQLFSLEKLNYLIKVQVRR